MKMKKLICALVTTTIVMSGLVGCGSDSKGENSSAEKEGNVSVEEKEESVSEQVDNTSGEIRVAYWGESQTPYLEQCVEEFNKIYPDIKVTLESSTFNEYWTKMEAAATGGSIADVFWMNGPNIEKYAKGDILMPIDEFLENSDINLSNYPESMVDLYNVDGKQYTVPTNFDTIGVWYNKALFDDAEVAYPTDDWTWEDMVEMATQLTKEDGSVYGIAAPLESQTGYYNTIYAYGGEVISEDKKSSGYDKPETQQGIQCWIDLQEAGLSPNMASLTETAADVQFMSGRIAMYWGGSWSLTAFMNSDVKDTLDVVELPSINGNKATVIHGKGYFIYKETKNPEAAWKWVEFMAGEKGQTMAAEFGAEVPTLSGTSELWAEAHPEYNLESFLRSAKNYSYVYPVSANTAEWNQYENENLKLAYNLEISVKEACEKLAEQMNEVLANE